MKQKPMPTTIDVVKDQIAIWAKQLLKAEEAIQNSPKFSLTMSKKQREEWDLHCKRLVDGTYNAKAQYARIMLEIFKEKLFYLERNSQ